MNRLKRSQGRSPAVSEDLKKQGVETCPLVRQPIHGTRPGLEEKLPNVNAANVEKIVADLDKEYDGDLDIAIANARYNLVANIAEKAIVRVGEASATLTDKIDALSLTAGSACRSSFSSCT